MENPPDLIVAVTSDDQYHDRKKLFNQEREEFVSNHQLRIARSLPNDQEFNDQSYLLKQRFHDEIQSVIDQQTELVHQSANHLSIHITDVLRKSVDDIESLRLLHQKELCTYSKAITDCIQHQSCEMSQLCHHVINEQRSTSPRNFFLQLLEDFQIVFDGVKSSFDSKMNYLNEIHSNTMENLQRKYEIEINELKCEFNLLSNR